MIKKTISITLILILILLNISSVSELNSHKDELKKNVEFILINGKEYKFTQYEVEDINYLVREVGSEIDVFKYDKSENVVTKNGVVFGTVENLFASSFDNSFVQAAASACIYPELTNVYDEQGNLAVFEACSTYRIAAGTATDDAISGVAVFTMITVTKVKSALLNFLGGKVLPVILDSILSTERQQFRSKYLILNPYTGLTQYKRLFVSYYFIGGSKFYGPEKSVWWF